MSSSLSGSTQYESRIRTGSSIGAPVGTREGVGAGDLPSPFWACDWPAITRLFAIVNHRPSG
jgi:hypothetical protein